MDLQICRAPRSSTLPVCCCKMLSMYAWECKFSKLPPAALVGALEALAERTTTKLYPQYDVEASPDTLQTPQYERGSSRGTTSSRMGGLTTPTPATLLRA